MKSRKSSQRLLASKHFEISLSYTTTAYPDPMNLSYGTKWVQKGGFVLSQILDGNCTYIILSFATPPFTYQSDLSVGSCHKAVDEIVVELPRLTPTE